ncbi:esterase-like activity of phytase family protein [Nocardioides daejeonensis]|uniref:esterase-like activity of phytase family protein n=1 Tax=Nocardioides daejeonensis TaxID=1046556 RepID=UPI0013A5ADAF|nr:esterase-like activity of phytase family protein [Nocardioides daejeonensis]
MSPRRSVAAAAVAVLPLSLLAVAGASAPGVAAGAPAPASSAFHRTATFPVYENLPSGVDPSSPTVAEISAVSEDGKTLIHTDALGKRIGFLDIADPRAPRGLGTIDLAAGHADDQPTSVAVVGDYVLVVIDSTGGDFGHPSGRVDVLRISDRSLVTTIDLGGQPDSIAISPDKKYAAIAIENQRDEEFTPDGGDEGDLPQLPAGGLVVLDLAGAPTGWTASTVPFTNADGSALDSFVAAGIDTPEDPEPEYVDVNAANKVAVTLQENNGVVIVDLASRSIDKVFSAGSVTVNGIDTKKDGLFDPTGSITAPREPDSIQWVGDGLVATANEGDWKGGTRGWTVFDAATGEVRWDAGNSFEKIATRHGLHTEDRAAKKGPEPEGLAFDTFDGVPYAFVGAERSNFVAVYDMSIPTAPEFVQILPTTNGPEGLLPIPGRNLIAVSSETDEAAKGVRATVSLFAFGPGAPAFPSVYSADVDGQPIGWGALGALSADPGNAGRMWTASDAAYKTGRIYGLDTTQTPAVIDEVIEVTDGTGAKPAIDIEGLHARAEGGFWLALEGATGAENKLVRTDSDGVIKQTVDLPAAITDGLAKQGLEGVSAWGTGGQETVFVTLQREVAGEEFVRIGRYAVATGEWTWFAYSLEKTDVAGDWLGLSEITALGPDLVSVIERDKLNGPRARVKRVYTVDLAKAGSTPAASSAPGAAPARPVAKTLALDLLPHLQAQQGWTQEKVEGFGIAGDGRLYAITDNDGLADATGETQLIRLGTAAKALPALYATRTTVKANKAKAKPGKKVKVSVTVTAGRLGTTTGKVTVTLGKRTLGKATLKHGRAVVRVKLTKKLIGKKKAIKLAATYAGTSTSGASTSKPVKVAIRRK